MFGSARQHPLEFTFIALLLLVIFSWAIGAGTSFFTVLFTGFFAALLFLGGAWLMTQARMMLGLIFFIIAFILVGALGAGWIRF